MIGPVHGAIMGAYWLALLGVGVWTARGQRTAEEFFLAGRRLPWWPVAMSMYASVTSAVTFMGVPAQAYQGNLSLWWTGWVSWAVAPVLARWIYPAYRRDQVTTTYEFVERRLGQGARRSAALLFLAARTSWLGLAIYAPALALSTVTGWPLSATLAGIGGVATLYTTLGGLAAVVWTDVLQFSVMIFGLAWMGVAIASTPASGSLANWNWVSALAGTAKDWQLDLTRLSTLGVWLGYIPIMLHEYGVDQVTAQRLLAVRSDREVRRAVWFNAVSDLVIVSALLWIGWGLRRVQTSVPNVVPPDALMVWYGVHALPPVVSGMLLAAIAAAAMSSVDSGINSVVTVFMSDFVQPTLHLSDRRLLTSSKVATLLVGGAAMGMASLAAWIGDLVRSFLTYVGLFNGPVLVLFAMAWLRVGRWSDWCVGAVVSAAMGVTWVSTRFAHELYLMPATTLVCALTVACASGVRHLLRSARRC